jgi:alkylhydroperoxidase family enzyme
MWAAMQSLKSLPRAEGTRAYMNKTRDEILANTYRRGLAADGHGHPEGRRQGAQRLRHDALVRFVRRIASSSGTVDAAEVQAVRDAGYSEQQVVETILAISAITFSNLINRVNDTVIDIAVQ